jgi:hypothetical protein
MTKPDRGLVIGAWGLIGHWALDIPASGFVIDSDFWFRHSGLSTPPSR